MGQVKHNKCFQQPRVISHGNDSQKTVAGLCLSSASTARISISFLYPAELNSRVKLSDSMQLDSPHSLVRKMYETVLYLGHFAKGSLDKPTGKSSRTDMSCRLKDKHTS